MRKAISNTRRAFSMLELIAVVVLLGLISSLGIVSITGQLDQARLIHASQAIAEADRKERIASRLSPVPGGMTIEKSKNQLRYRNSFKTIALGKSVKIAEVVLGSFATDKNVLFSQSGQSATYAIRLESRRGANLWIVIVGMTGQSIISDSSEEVRSLLAMATG